MGGARIRCKPSHGPVSPLLLSLERREGQRRGIALGLTPAPGRHSLLIGGEHGPSHARQSRVVVVGLPVRAPLIPRPLSVVTRFWTRPLSGFALSAANDGLDGPLPHHAIGIITSTVVRPPCLPGCPINFKKPPRGDMLDTRADTPMVDLMVH